MIQSTLFIRVVAQDKNRGYMLLIGYDSAVVQRTASQFITLNAVTRDGLNAVIEQVKINYRASDVRDVTAPGIVKQLKKLFGETDDKSKVDSGS